MRGGLDSQIPPLDRPNQAVAGLAPVNAQEFQQALDGLPFVPSTVTYVDNREWAEDIRMGRNTTRPTGAQMIALFEQQWTAATNRQQ